MSDLIDREQAIAEIEDLNLLFFYEANEHSKEAYQNIKRAIQELPYMEVGFARPKGKWINKDVMPDRKDAKIPEWQVAQCSVCGRLHTTPYLYGFRHYPYCPNCGAEMEE